MTSSTQAQEGSLSWLRDLWERGWLKGLLLVAAVIFAYQPAWYAGFIWDDDVYVTNNPLLTAPDGLGRIWFSLDTPSQYFPLTYTTFRIEWALWGLNPAGYHWVNILLHATNALLVWWLLKRSSVPGAWLTAAIFALHPVQVESVAWVTELKSVLSLFFFLLTLLAWIEFVEDRPKPLWRYYVLSLTFYGLALCSKTTACTLPAALLLILWLQHKLINRQRLMQIVPFLAMGMGMGLLALWWERYHQGTFGKPFAMGLLERVLVASHAVWFYAGKLVWPANLTFSYPRWTINPTEPLAYGWLVAGAGLGGAIYFARRFVGRGVEVAALFYVVTLSPLLGFFMLYTFRYTFVADHYQYVAMIGPVALVAAGITLALGRFEKRNPFLKPVFCGALLLVLGILSWRQSGMYADIETLWRTTINRNPECSMAYNNLGLLLQQRGQMDEAMIVFQKAVALQPDNAEAWDSVGYVFFLKGRVGDAIPYFQKALEIRPTYADAHNDLGLAFVQKGQVDKAMVHFQKALEIRPRYIEVMNNLAWILATAPKASLRNGAKAVELAQQAERLSRGQNPTILRTLAAAYAEAGRFSEAVAAAQRAMQLAASQTNTALVNSLRVQIALYRAGSPFRDSSLMNASVSHDRP